MVLDTAPDGSGGGFAPATVASAAVEMADGPEGGAFSVLMEEGRARIIQRRLLRATRPQLTAAAESEVVAARAAVQAATAALAAEMPTPSAGGVSGACPTAASFTRGRGPRRPSSHVDSKHSLESAEGGGGAPAGETQRSAPTKRSPRSSGERHSGELPREATTGGARLLAVEAATAAPLVDHRGQIDLPRDRDRDREPLAASVSPLDNSRTASEVSAHPISQPTPRYGAAAAPHARANAAEHTGGGGRWASGGAGAADDGSAAQQPPLLPPWTLRPSAHLRHLRQEAAPSAEQLEQRLWLEQQPPPDVQLRVAIEVLHEVRRLVSPPRTRVTPPRRHARA